MHSEEVILILIISTALILLLGTVMVVALLIQNKRKYKHKVQLSDMQVHYEKTLLQTQLKILDETYSAISQNLHDNVGSNISTAMLLLYKDEKIDPSEQESNRKEALAILDKVVDDLRNIAHSLNPGYLDEIGLTEAIKQRIGQLAKTKKYEIELFHTPSAKRLNRQKQVILFYIFQEAINNINIHSQARKIFVRINYEKDYLVLQIKDDGTGIAKPEDPEQQKLKGTGLLNMKNNATLIGAALDINSEAGKGTHIIVSVPHPYH